MALADVTMRELLIFEACDEVEKLHLARIAELEAAISSAIRHLTNVQPAIDQFVQQEERAFIDNHVDAALEALGGVAGGVRFSPTLET